MSMEAKDLRIGNLFYPIRRTNEVHLPDEVPMKVLTIGFDEVECLMSHLIPAQEKDWHKVKLKDIAGIPLTEDLFKKLGDGFSFAENFSCYWRDGDVCIEQYGEGTEALSHIKHVHQLQNLYYALTGTELIHNLP